MFAAGTGTEAEMMAAAGTGTGGEETPDDTVADAALMELDASEEDKELVAVAVVAVLAASRETAQQDDTELDAALALSAALSAEADDAALEQALQSSTEYTDATPAPSPESAEAGVYIPFETPKSRLSNAPAVAASSTQSMTAAGTGIGAGVLAAGGAGAAVGGVAFVAAAPIAAASIGFGTPVTSPNNTEHTRTIHNTTVHAIIHVRMSGINVRTYRFGWDHCWQHGRRHDGSCRGGDPVVGSGSRAAERWCCGYEHFNYSRHGCAGFGGRRGHVVSGCRRGGGGLWGQILLCETESCRTQRRRWRRWEKWRRRRQRGLRRSCVRRWWRRWRAC